MPNKLLGQHFLRNADVVKKIITAVDAQKNETVIEIGPGNGELTIPLAKACEDGGATLIAIEKDAGLAASLTVMMREFHIEIIRADVLEVLESQISDRGARVKLVGNLPYYLTGQLLRIISELESRPSRCVFMVQKEVAERMVGGVHDMNRLAASVQFWADAKILTIVPRKDFSPAPKVDSAVIVLDKKQKLPIADAEKYFSAMRVLFAQPRKTILNNLTSGERGSESKKKDFSREVIVKELEKLEINAMARPQDLSVEQIAKIAEVFEK